MKIFQKIMLLVLLFSILVYPIKRHTDTIVDLAKSVVQMLGSLFATSEKIYQSKELLGFPADSLEIARAFKIALPQEKEYFIEESLYQDPLLSQRMIEFNFPLLFNKNARCGFIPNNIQLGDSLKIIEKKGAYQIVCSS